MRTTCCSHLRGDAGVVERGQELLAGAHFVVHLGVAAVLDHCGTLKLLRRQPSCYFRRHGVLGVVDLVCDLLSTQLQAATVDLASVGVEHAQHSAVGAGRRVKEVWMSELDGGVDGGVLLLLARLLGIEVGDDLREQGGR